MTIFSVFILISVFSVSMLGAEDRIVMTHILYRHGDRSAQNSYKTNIYNESDWPQGYEQLTVLGMKQHYELGTFLRKRYIEGQPFNLLNSSYDRFEVIVRSSAKDRTMMSAASNLAALYPPHGDQIWKEDLLWQPIPIHTVPNSEDNLLFPDSPCPMHDKVLEEVLRSDEAIKLESDNKEFLEFIKNKTEKFDLNLDNIWKIYDILFCESIHKFTLPEWAFEKFYGKTVFDLLSEFNEIHFDLKYNRRNEAKLRAGNLLFKIINDTKTLINKREDVKKAYIYSTHDVSIIALFATMGFFDKTPPPYAACAMIDVFEKILQNGSVGYSIVVSYRNITTEDPFVITLPGCDAECPFETFVKLTEDKTVKNWKEECSINITQTYPDYMAIIALSSLGVLVILLSLVFLINTKKTTGFY